MIDLTELDYMHLFRTCYGFRNCMQVQWRKVGLVEVADYEVFNEKACKTHFDFIFKETIFVDHFYLVSLHGGEKQEDL